MRKKLLDHELDRPPHLTEVKRAMWKLKSGKAAGSSGILPEMVKAGRGDEDFLGMMCDLVSTVLERKEGFEGVSGSFPYTHYQER